MSDATILHSPGGTIDVEICEEGSPWHWAIYSQYSPTCSCV
jgi:hypothetical protein